MSQCANCRRPVPVDPNEAEDVEECRYCAAIVCSDKCLEQHEEQAHAAEALPAMEDER